MINARYEGAIQCPMPETCKVDPSARLKCCEVDTTKSVIEQLKHRERRGGF